MYSIGKKEVAQMPEAFIRQRQMLFEEFLPRWEERIAKVAHMTLPKSDQGLMGIDDLVQEIRSAVWEAALKYDPGKGTSINTWIFFAIKQASSHIAHVTFYNMPHTADGQHIMQLGAVTDGMLYGQDNDELNNGFIIDDPDSVGRIETELQTQECIDLIRPILNEGFEQEVFDMMIVQKLPGGVIAKSIKTLLFDTSLKHQRMLSSGKLPVGLRREFTNNGITLSNNVYVKTTEEGTWQITDRQATKRKIYFAEKSSEGKLNVFGSANDARVSAVRTKIKVAFVLLNGLPLEEASTSKSAESLASRVKHLFASFQRTSELPPRTCCMQPS